MNSSIHKQAFSSINKQIFITCLLLLQCLHFPAIAAPTLSNQAEISLLTCDAGQDLYAAFGHSAIRIQDPIQGIDETYNYGTFDFDTPGFYAKFMQGKLKYKMDKDSFRRFHYVYNVRQRTVVQQTLELDSTAKQQLFDLLEVNYLPQNRYYLYDFFFDNCSTRIRDIIEDETGEVRYPLGESRYTFREMIQLYLNDMPWSDFGIDLALGMPCDAPASAYDEMFLPDFLHDATNATQLNGNALMLNDQLLLGEEDLPSQDLPLSPMEVGYIYFGASLLLLLLGFVRPIFRKLALRIHLVIGGLLGLMLVLLWFATDHTITAKNLNLLWAWPAHLFLLASSFSTGWKRMYLVVFTALQLIVLVFWKFWPQDFHEAFIPFIAAHLLSAAMHLWKSKAK